MKVLVTTGNWSEGGNEQVRMETQVTTDEEEKAGVKAQ